MMGKVRVQAHPPSVATLVEARDLVPGLWRGRIIDAQILFTAQLGRGVAHSDADLLEPAGTHLPDGVRRAGDRSYGDLSGHAHTKRGGQHRVLAGQLDGPKWLRGQSSEVPEVGKCSVIIPHGALQPGRCRAPFHPRSGYYVHPPRQIDESPSDQAERASLDGVGDIEIGRAHV